MQGSRPPRPVVGVSPAAGDKPQPYRGRRCRRRCWVPALPRPVVRVSPAAGDKPQPYIRSVALPPAGWGRGPAVQGAVVVVSLAVGDECRRCWVPALPRPVVGVLPAAGDKPQPYIRTAALPPAAGDQRRRYRGRWLLFRWRLGMSAGGAGFRPSHVRWSVFCRRRGTSPSPTLGRWRCRRPVGDEGRRCRGRWLLFRWRLGMSAGGAGFPPSHVRW